RRRWSICISTASRHGRAGDCAAWPPAATRGRAPAMRETLRRECPVVLKTDFWRIGILRAPATQVIAAGSIDAIDTRWMYAQGPLQYLADPFGLWRDERLYLFMEVFDYRTHRGGIDAAIYDKSLS